MKPWHRRTIVWTNLMAAGWLLAVMIVAVSLGGCPSLRAPDGFEQRLAYSYGTYTAVVNTAAHGTEAGTLAVEDAEAALAAAQGARQLLDAAHVAYGLGDEVGANDRLGLAMSLLTELQRYLEARGL